MIERRRRRRVFGVRRHLGETDPTYRSGFVDSAYRSSLLLTVAGWTWDAIGDAAAWVRRRLRRRRGGRRREESRTGR
jgi:hypothetical protein